MRTKPVSFPLGAVVATTNALATIPILDVHAALDRHASGYWGDLCEEDRDANERALVQGERLLSVYRTAGGATIWVITEWDRSVTTVLLPEEY